MRAALALALMLAGSAAAAQERPADCLLTIEGRDLIRGRCTFSPIDDDGSFQIMSPDGGTFAQVLVTGRGVADGYWNGGDFAGHAHDPLGVLVRDGACWKNEAAAVCAW